MQTNFCSLDITSFHFPHDDLFDFNTNAIVCINENMEVVSRNYLSFLVQTLYRNIINKTISIVYYSRFTAITVMGTVKKNPSFGKCFEKI